MYTNEKEDAVVLVMSAWDVMTAMGAQIAVMTVRHHLPDMSRSLSHTTSERVAW
jgi:hypothetical protein